jgi:hypothetical protein
MITGEIKDVTIEPVKKRIILWVQFKRDGVELPYWEEHNGVNCWKLYAHFRYFLKKTPLQIKGWVDANIKSQISNIVQIITGLDAVNGSILALLQANAIGYTVSLDSIELQVDTDNDGVPDTTVTIDTDGNIT